MTSKAIWVAGIVVLAVASAYLASGAAAQAVPRNSAGGHAQQARQIDEIRGEHDKMIGALGRKLESVNAELDMALANDSITPEQAAGFRRQIRALEEQMGDLQEASPVQCGYYGDDWAAFGPGSGWSCWWDQPRKSSDASWQWHRGRSGARGQSMGCGGCW